MNATTFSTKYSFDESFTRSEETHIRAALCALDDALTAAGEAVLEDYEHAETLWYTSRGDCFPWSIKATNAVMAVDIYGNSTGHLIKKIGLVTGTVRSFGRAVQPKSAGPQNENDKGSDERSPIPPRRSSKGSVEVGVVSSPFIIGPMRK